MARDWQADLWPSSFKGIHFWTERDKQSVGQRLMVNELPGSDVPTIIPLGAKAQVFEFTAYFVGDSSDTEADALVQGFLAAGPGPLVLPAQGPVQAWAQNAQRDRERDRAGYFAFTLQFVREAVVAGAALPTNYLAQRVYDANDALVGAAATLLASVTL